MDFYNFIYDVNAVRQTETLFISPYADSVFTLYLAYRHKKVDKVELAEKKYPTSDLWHSKVIYPSRNNTPIENILEKSIVRTFHRPTGAFDPFENACDLPQNTFGIFLLKCIVNLIKFE